MSVIPRDSRTVAVVDSGAMLNVAPDNGMIKQSAMGRGPTLYDASGNVMEVVGQGIFTQAGITLGKWAVSTHLDQALLSVPVLTGNNYSVLFYGKGDSYTSYHPIDGIIFEAQSGEVCGEIHRGQKVDLSLLKPSGWFLSQPPQLPKINPNLDNEVCRIGRIYGLPELHKSKLVPLLQATFQCSQKEMLMMCNTIDNFPVTGKQIKKYWTQETCRMAAMIRRRMVSYKRFKAISERVVRDRPGTTRRELRALEDRNNIIGMQIGADLLVIGSIVILVVIDKASGTPFLSVAKVKEGKRGLIRMVEEIFLDFKNHGHDVREFISDCEKIFSTKRFRFLLKRYGITQVVTSAPGNHAFNGLVEVNIKILKIMAYGMLNCARHLPAEFIVSALQYACVLMRFRASRRVGMSISRMEDFFAIRPDYKKLALFPFGQPCLFLNYEKKAISGARNIDHRELLSNGLKGIYLSPAETVVGGINVLCLSTKVAVISDTFNMLDEVPTCWTRYSRSFLRDWIREEEDPETDFEDQDSESFTPEATGIHDIEDPFSEAQNHPVLDRQDVLDLLSREEDEDIEMDEAPPHREAASEIASIPVIPSSKITSEISRDRNVPGFRESLRANMRSQPIRRPNFRTGGYDDARINTVIDLTGMDDDELNIRLHASYQHSQEILREKIIREARAGSKQSPTTSADRPATNPVRKYAREFIDASRHLDGHSRAASPILYNDNRTAQMTDDCDDSIPPHHMDLGLGARGPRRKVAVPTLHW